MSAARLDLQQGKGTVRVTDQLRKALLPMLTAVPPTQEGNPRCPGSLAWTDNMYNVIHSTSATSSVFGLSKKASESNMLEFDTLSVGNIDKNASAAAMADSLFKNVMQVCQEGVSARVRAGGSVAAVQVREGQLKGYDKHAKAVVPKSDVVPHRKEVVKFLREKMKAAGWRAVHGGDFTISKAMLMPTAPGGGKENRPPAPRPQQQVGA